MEQLNKRKPCPLLHSQKRGVLMFHSYVLATTTPVTYTQYRTKYVQTYIQLYTFHWLNCHHDFSLEVHASITELAPYLCILLVRTYVKFGILYVCGCLPCVAGLLLLLRKSICHVAHLDWLDGRGPLLRHKGSARLPRHATLCQIWHAPLINEVLEACY